MKRHKKLVVLCINISVLFQYTIILRVKLYLYNDEVYSYLVRSLYEYL